MSILALSGALWLNVHDRCTYKLCCYLCIRLLSVN